MRTVMQEDLVRYVTTRDPDEHGLGTVHLFAERTDGSREEVPHVSYHSPTGMEYGYGGSGPADLALSLLAHYYGCDAAQLSKKLRGWDLVSGLTEAERRAVHWHQDFKWAHVARPAREGGLIIHRAELLRFIDAQLEADLAQEGG